MSNAGQELESVTPRQPPALTVSELSEQIRAALETRFRSLWVEGEISNFKRAESGHLYFSLKDDKAQIRAVMFRGSAAALRFEPANGTRVLAQGDVTVYPPRGDYQLKVVRMQPEGVGALQLAFEQLKKKLAAEGLFAEARKRPIPAMPRRIGVVTSPTGAAIRDILKVLRRRFPNIEVILCPCRVQGDGAAEEIAAAIATLNELTSCEVLIVGRGGGSLEDLWAFNEERVARAIFHSKIPIISAVGHEIDFTIADFVADLRAPTPSAAAEAAVPVKAELARQVVELAARLERSLTRKTGWLRERLGVGRRLEGALARQVVWLRERLDVGRRLQPALERQLAWSRGRLEALAPARLRSRPASMVEQASIRVDELLSRLVGGAGITMQLKQSAFEGALNRLEPVSPVRTMKRGYSVVTRLDDPRPLTDAGELAAGDQVQVRMSSGTLACNVTDVLRETPPRGEQGKLPF